MTAIRLTEAQVEAIRAHAAAVYPRECCGLLLGRGEGAQKEIAIVLPADNDRDEPTPDGRYQIPTEQIVEGDRLARGLGADMIGFYHSHPDHAAEPSPLDVKYAWPGLSYLILEVRAGEPEEARSWVLREDRSGFEPEEVRIGRAGEEE